MLYTCTQIVAKGIASAEILESFYMTFSICFSDSWNKNTKDYTLIIIIKTLFLIILNILKIMKNYEHINILLAIDKFLIYTVYLNIIY